MNPMPYPVKMSFYAKSTKQPRKGLKEDLLSLSNRHSKKIKLLKTLIQIWATEAHRKKSNVENLTLLRTDRRKK